MTYTNKISSGTGEPSTDNWVTEDGYWRENYANRPYATESMDYEAYQGAYRYGYDLYSRHSGKRFDELSEDDVRKGWHDTSPLSLKWEEAKEAIRDAYDRLLKIAPNPKGESVAYEYKHEPA